MKWRIAMTLLLTLIMVRLLYGWRKLTFLIWTVAAIINHAHPLLTVSVIEGIVILGIVKASWLAAETILDSWMELKWKCVSRYRKSNLRN